MTETSSDTTPPTRRIRLLEARLNRHKPAQPALPTSGPPTPPTATDSPEDDVRSFSSDSLPSPRPANPRRKYAPAPPAPRSRSRDATPSVRTRPPPPSTPAKKRRRGSSPAQPRSRPVHSYFKPVPTASAPDSPSRTSVRAQPTETKRALKFTSPTAVDDRSSLAPRRPLDGSPVPADAYGNFRALVDSLRAENERLREGAKIAEELRAENEDLRAQVEIELPELREQLLEKEKIGVQLADQTMALSDALRGNVVELAKMQRDASRRQATVDSERLGKLVVERSRTSLHEMWEEGGEWKRLDAQLKCVQEEREEVEKKRKELLKRKAQNQKNECQWKPDIVQTGSTGLQDSDMPPPPSPMSRPVGVPFEETAAYAQEQEEVYRVRLQLLKKEESALQEKRQTLAMERDILVRELRRQSDERGSSFNDFPVLNERYVVLNLLGRGGFSEVFKAFDLKNACYVACKIHQLASNWSEEKKRNFIRHAMREYEIHKSLKHPRVVQLVDIFEIDENTFCTVLEYCDGSDLDSYLRAHKVLPEKEAKSIISQVFSGLLYLAEQKRRIIHYDLKPGNILLHKGEVQITDFGLSKIMNETESTVDGMELTSQGAGTMWYLPPECFETASQARISLKVDVWSAGVILFQILYGRKPFGHNQSQEKMFREKTVKHQELEFPNKPAVSDVAKDFMRKCLTRRASSRPDVRQILMHPFLRRR